jgi:hypothetical protein
MASSAHAEWKDSASGVRIRVEPQVSMVSSAGSGTEEGRRFSAASRMAGKKKQKEESSGKNSKSRTESLWAEAQVLFVVDFGAEASTP